MDFDIKTGRLSVKDSLAIRGFRWVCPFWHSGKKCFTIWYRLPIWTYQIVNTKSRWRRREIGPINLSYYSRDEYLSKNDIYWNKWYRFNSLRLSDSSDFERLKVSWDPFSPQFELGVIEGELICHFKSNPIYTSPTTHILRHISWVVKSALFLRENRINDSSLTDKVPLKWS